MYQINQTRDAYLILADGTHFDGYGLGAKGSVIAELCFNTAMTGYQEVITDPSYAGQIICFTFPHIGNVGTNNEDHESAQPAALGAVLKFPPTQASNWRALQDLSEWMIRHNLVGISGIDTRYLTRKIRELGAPTALLHFMPNKQINEREIVSLLAGFPGLDGMELAKKVTSKDKRDWDQSLWKWPRGYDIEKKPIYKVAAIDYGTKNNILRCLTSLQSNVKVFPATVTVEEILNFDPDGIFLSNGPGDPAATSEYAVPILRTIIDKTEIPVFGICLGHQLLALALGGKTIKMNHGHHGANHPVKELVTGKVEITSMNHGFTVEKSSLPSNLIETHISLFDGTNCGIAFSDRPIFSVQFHPEASPGPQDSFYLFQRFQDYMKEARLKKKKPLQAV